MVYASGKTDQHTSETGFMICCMEKVYYGILEATRLLASSKKVDSAALECTSPLKEPSMKASG